MRDTVPRVTRYFELHTRAHLQAWAQTDERGVGYEDWLRACRTPVYMQARYPDIPASVAFPKQALIKRFGDWFTNSIAWMLALALDEGVDRLSVYGVELKHQGEYEEEYPCVAYFVGLARGMGIPVEIPAVSLLCKAPQLYGYDEPTAHAHLFPRTQMRGLSGEPSQALLSDLALRAAWLRSLNLQPGDPIPDLVSA